MPRGIIFKAISGFYYVDAGGEVLECRARGRFRKDDRTPLVGDSAEVTVTGPGKGVVEDILPRKNAFVRPPVANVDRLVIVASAAIPVTDTFLIDRMTAIAAHNNSDCIICINKSDLDRGGQLYDIYRSAGFETFQTSAETGEGIDALGDAIREGLSVFTGNSGVGKSSILNVLDPSFSLAVGEISRKLGRGRHTTRHVELYRLKNGAVVADTPGFSSFDTEQLELAGRSALEAAFRDFAPYLGCCRFNDCAHVRDTGCALLSALEEGAIQPTRHASYVRLLELVQSRNDWERPPVK